MARFAALSLDVMVVERDREEVASWEFSSCTSSIEEVESRRAVSEGEPLTGSSECSSGLTDFVSSLGVSSVVRVLLVETLGVVIEEEDGGRSVRDRTEAEDLDCGREDLSGASSNMSFVFDQHSNDGSW